MASVQSGPWRARGFKRGTRRAEFGAQLQSDGLKGARCVTQETNYRSHQAAAVSAGDLPWFLELVLQFFCFGLLMSAVIRLQPIVHGIGCTQNGKLASVAFGGRGFFNVGFWSRHSPWPCSAIGP
jgi:hypothetical protein